MAANEGGPYVELAVFCEKFIRGAQSGQLSLINIIEGVTVAGPDPDEMPPFSLQNLTVVINLWAGQARGRYPLRLRPEAPSGIQEESLVIGQLNFSNMGTALGIDTIVPMPPYEVMEEGTYWFDVLLGSDEQLLTRMPLAVTYAPQF